MDDAMCAVVEVVTSAWRRAAFHMSVGVLRNSFSSGLHITDRVVCNLIHEPQDVLQVAKVKVRVRQKSWIIAALMLQLSVEQWRLHLFPEASVRDQH